MAEEKIFEIKIPKGITASGLAKQYFTDLDTIARLNPIITARDPSLSKIVEGEVIKLPIISPEKASQEYQDDLDKRLEKLYAGEYGIEFAREKVGKELESLYPYVDVWTDIYTKIPDQWEKIAFPERVSTPEVLPEIKKSAWGVIGSFIDSKILTPIKSTFKEVAFDFFKVLPETPDFSKVIRGTEDILRLREYMPPGRESLSDWIRTKAKGIADEFHKELDEMKRTLGEDWLKVERAPVIGIALRWGGITREIQEAEKAAEEFEEYAEQIKKIQKGFEWEEVEKILDEPTAIKPWLDDTVKTLFNLFEVEAPKLGIVFKETEEGGFEIDSETTDKNINLRKEELLGIPTNNPLVAKALSLSTTQATDLAQLAVYVGDQASRIQTWITDPENLKQSRIKTFHDLWTTALGDPDRIRTLDPSLTSWDEDLDKHARSLVRTEDYYRSEIPKWNEELEKLTSGPLFDLLQRTDLTEADKDEIIRLANLKKPEEVLRISDLLRFLDNANTFFNIEGGVYNIVQDPKIWTHLSDYIKSQAEPDTELLKLLARVDERNKWFIDHETELREGYVQKLMKAQSVEDITSLENEVKESIDLSEKDKKAWLDFFVYQKDLVRFNNRLVKATHNLAKISKAYEKSVHWDTLQKARKESEKIRESVSKSRWATLTNWNDFKTMAPFILESAGELNLPIPITEIKDYRIQETKKPDGTIARRLIPTGLKIRRLKGKEMFVFFKWFYDEVLVKKCVPAALTGLATMYDILKFSGEADYLWDAKWYPEFLKKMDRKVDPIFVAGIKQMINLPSETYLPKGLDFVDAMRTGRLKEYWTQTFKYYSSPAAYEDIYIKEPTKILWRAGKVKIGPYTFENLDNPEQILALNPHLTDTRVIPAGTKLKIPRYTPVPRISDLWKPKVRYEMFKKHPIVMYGWDEFVPAILLDPFSYIWEFGLIKSTASKIAGGFTLKGVKIPGVKTLGLKAVGKIGTSVGRADWAFKMQRITDFVDDLFALTTGQPIRPDLWPHWTQKVQVPARKVRAAFYQTTILNQTHIENQAIIGGTMSEAMRELVSRPLINSQVWGVLQEYSVKVGRLDDFNKALIKYVLDPTQDPGEAVMRCLQTLNLTSTDIFDLGRGVIYLKNPLNQLIKKTYNAPRLAARMQQSFNISVQRLSPKGRMYFQEIWDNATESGGELTSLVWRKSYKNFDDALAAFKKSHLKRYPAKAQAEILKELNQGELMYWHYLDFTEDARILINSSREVAKVAKGTRFYKVPLAALDKYPMTKQRLIRQGGHTLFYHVDADRYPVFIYCADLYKKRQPEVIIDFWRDVFDRRMADLSEIPYAKIGNQLQHTEMIKTGKIVKGWDPIRKMMVDKDEYAKRIVFHGDYKSVNLEDAMITSFYQDVWPKLSVDNQSAIARSLKKWVPASKARKVKRVGLTHREFDPKERLPDNLIAGQYEGYARTADIFKEVDTYEGIKRVIREAAALDELKESLLEKNQLKFYHEVLSKIPSEKLSPKHKIHLILLDEFGDKPILPLDSVTRIILMGDFISSSQALVLAKRLRDFADHASWRFWNARKGLYKKFKVPEEKVRRLVPEFYSQDLLISDIEGIQKKFILLKKEIPLEAIIPARVPYHPEWPREVERKEFEKRLSVILEKKTESLTEPLKKLAKADHNTAYRIFREIDKTDVSLKKLECALVSLPKETTDLSSTFTKQIDLFYKKYKPIFLVSNRTPRDLEIIKFLDKRGYPKRIFIPPKIKALDLKYPDLISLIERNPFYSTFNPNDYLSRRGVLRILARSFTDNTEKFARPAFLNEFLDLRNFTYKGQNFFKKILGPSPPEIMANLRLSSTQKAALVRGWQKRTGQLVGTYNTKARDLLNNIGSQGIELRFSKAGDITSASLRSQFAIGASAIQEGMVRRTQGIVLGSLIPDVDALLKKTELLPRGLDFLQDLGRATGVHRISSLSAYSKLENVLDEIQVLAIKIRAVQRHLSSLDDKISEFSLRLGTIDDLPRRLKTLKELRIEELNAQAWAAKKIGKAPLRSVKEISADLNTQGYITKVLKTDEINRSVILKSRAILEKQRRVWQKTLDSHLDDLSKKFSSQDILLARAGTPGYALLPGQSLFVKKIIKGKRMDVAFGLEIDSAISDIRRVLKNYDDYILRARKSIVKGKYFETVEVPPEIVKHQQGWDWIGGRKIPIESYSMTYGKMSRTIKLDWRKTLPEFQKVRRIFNEDLESLEALKRCFWTQNIANQNKIYFTRRELFEYFHGRTLPSLSKKMKRLEPFLIRAERELAPFPGYESTTVKFLNQYPELEKNLAKTWVKGRSLKNLEEALPLSDIGKMEGVIPGIFLPRVPKSFEDILDTVKSLEARGVVTVIDTEGILARAPFKKKFFKFRVVHVPELNESKLLRIARKGEIPSSLERNGMEILRDVYLSDSKIAIWAKNPEWAKGLLDSLQANYLSVVEKNYLKAYTDLFLDVLEVRKKTGFKGPPWRYPWTPEEFKTKYFTSKDISDLLMTKYKPTEAIEAVWKRFQLDAATREFEFQLRKTGALPPGIAFHVTDLRRTPVLIVAPDVPTIYRKYLDDIADMIRIQKCRVYLAKTKLSRGEITIIDFLKKEKLPFNQVVLDNKSFGTLIKEYPTFLYPVGKKFKGVRADIFDTAGLKARMFTSVTDLKENFYRETMESLKDWSKSINKFPPEFIQESVRRGLRLNLPWLRRLKVRGLLVDWIQFNNRLKLRDIYELHAAQALVAVRRARINEIRRTTGRDILTPAERLDILDEIKRTKIVNEDIAEFVYQLEKKPMFYEIWQKKLAKRLALIENKSLGTFGLAMMPMDGFQHLLWSKNFVSGLLKLSYTIPKIFNVVFTPLGWARGFWIKCVLYWRVAWYLRNAYDDGLRGALTAKSLRYWFRANAQQQVAFAHFIRKFAGDIKDIPTEFFRVPARYVDDLEMIGGPGVGSWFRTQMAVASRKPYQLWDINVAMKTRKAGVWEALDKKAWKASGLDSMLSFEDALRVGPMRTPAGEFLTKEVKDYLAQAGLFQVTADPIFARKILSYLPETTLWQRLKKRWFVLDADIQYFAGVTENLRRTTLIHDLIFRKAMSLAETKARTWGYLFNYRDLTLVGRIFRNFFPFYAFNANVIRLFISECVKRGPATYFAAMAFLNTWSKAVEDLPEFYRDRIPVGNQMYWRPWASVFEILNFAREPKRALLEWVDNPLRAPLGFGLDPAWTTFVGAASEKKYWDIGTDLKAMTGWTESEIDKYLSDQKIIRDFSIDKEWWLETLMTFVPPVKLFKSLFELDARMMTDGISILKSKKLREWMKFFGLNIVKWDDVERFRFILFETPPHLRKEIQQELKKENPEAWRILEDQFAKAAFIKIYQAKGKEREQALLKLQEKGILMTYFDLEERKEGSGKLWLERNKDAKVAVERFFNQQEMTPWKMYSRAKYNTGVLRSQINAAADLIYKPEVIAKAEILGIEIPFGISGNKSEFLDQFFDERGNLKISTKEEMILIMGDPWVDKFFSKEQINLQALIEDNARDRYHEWLYEKVKGETEEDRRYAAKMANWYSVLPANIAELPEKKAAAIWNAYWHYFERYFTDEEKECYFESLTPWYGEYRKKIREYINLWSGLVKRFGEEDFEYFSEFSKQPLWFQNLYFYKYPNKKVWYPFAQEWVRMLSEIEALEKKTFVFQSDLREKASKYFWSHENIVKNYWDKDNPGFYQYMKDWQTILAITEADPQKYFETFYSMSEDFQKRFFKRNPEKKKYYPFLQKWLGFIQEDKKAWDERRIRTTKAGDWFWSVKNKKAREIYGKEKQVAPGKSILDYLNHWHDIFYKVEDNVERYFEEFFKQEDWFKDHFFRTNPNKAIYYSVVYQWVKRIKKDNEVLEKTGESPKTARIYYQKYIRGVKKVRNAWESENPGIINYLDTWSDIIDKTEKNPEIYFEEFYKQPKTFQNRFFRNNTNKAIYYPVLWKWIQAIRIDKKNWEEKNIRTHVARDHFDSWKKTKVGRAYAADNPITDKKNVIHYLELWQKVMEETEENPEKFFMIFDKQSDWFKNHYYSNHPDRKLYYPFARELGKQGPENFARFFWKSEYENARQAWERDKPGFLAYMTFWKTLGSLAETGSWDLYFKQYFASENKIFRQRHQRNNPGAEQRFRILWEYQKLPMVTWEDKRARRNYLKANPELLEWWSRDLSANEAEMREKVEHYYILLDKVPADGIGKSYYQEVQKWKNAAKDYLEKNPDVLLFLQSRSKKYTGQKPEIFALVRAYFDIDLPSLRGDFVKEHPELKEYFYNLNPPGIRKVLDLQNTYFALASHLKSAYLDLHPELLDYWEVIRGPWSQDWAPKKFRSYVGETEQVKKCYDLYLSRNWIEAEKERAMLSDIYKMTGDLDEDAWFRTKIYRMAMETWIKLIQLNEFMGVYYFRQLPRWLREIYYSKHPEKQYISKQPLSRFLVEPLRIWDALNPDLAWAYKLLYKYGRNLPAAAYQKVRKIMVETGEWEDRIKWTQEDWASYWHNRGIALNEIHEFDVQNLPLLKTELKKATEVHSRAIRALPWRGPRLGKMHPFF